MSINNILPTDLKLQKGTITRLESEKSEGFFKFTSQDRENNTIGIVAVLVALVGMGATAAGTLTRRNETWPAYYVKITLDSDKRFTGWLNAHDLKEGDEVEIIYSDKESAKKIYAVTKPKQRVIAMYPHTKRGRKAHIKYLIKVTFFSHFLFFFFSLLFSYFVDNDSGLQLLKSSFILTEAVALFMIFIILLFQFEYIPYCILAERVFNALKLEDVKNIDLVKISRKNKRPDDHKDLGWTFYRY